MFGIVNPPTVPFTEGETMAELPQSEKDKTFARQDLENGCNEGIYEEVSGGEAERLVSTGHMISSSFFVWQEDTDGNENERFIVNFSKQSKHWDKGSVQVETLPAYAIGLKRGDHMISFDVKSGYRHLRLASCMRDWFLFRYDGKFYRCIALPFGCGRSPMWFSSLTAPLVQYMTCEMGYRVLCYLEIFKLLPPASERYQRRKTARWQQVGSRIYLIISG